MEGFLGWVTKAAADLLNWVVGVWSLVVDACVLTPQVMGFVLVLMRFLLVCGGSVVFPLHLAEKYWPSLGSSSSGRAVLFLCRSQF